MDFFGDLAVLSEREADEVLALIEGLEGGTLSLASLKGQLEAMAHDAESSPVVRTLLGCIIAAAEGGGGVGRMVLWAETIDECLESALVDASVDEIAWWGPLVDAPFAGLSSGSAPQERN